MSTETRQPASPHILYTARVLGYVFFGLVGDGTESFGWRSKVLDKIKDEKEKNQFLTPKQLAALVGASYSTLHDRQENEARLLCYRISSVSLHVNNPLSALRVAFLNVFVGSYYNFTLQIVKIGVLAPCRVSLLNLDKLISPLNADKAVVTKVSG